MFINGTWSLTINEWSGTRPFGPPTPSVGSVSLGFDSELSHSRSLLPSEFQSNFWNNAPLNCRENPHASYDYVAEYHSLQVLWSCGVDFGLFASFHPYQLFGAPRWVDGGSDYTAVTYHSNFYPAPVPEPDVLMLLILGLALSWAARQYASNS